MTYCPNHTVYGLPEQRFARGRVPLYMLLRLGCESILLICQSFAARPLQITPSLEAIDPSTQRRIPCAAPNSYHS